MGRRRGHLLSGRQGNAPARRSRRALFRWRLVFPDKPAMMYWLMILAYEVFGTTEFAARFWSAMAGIGSVLLVYRIGQTRSRHRPPLGAHALATSLNFNVIARAATPNALLTLFSTLSVYLFVRATATAQARSGPRNQLNAPWAGQRTFAPSWPGWVLLLGHGLRVLTKGPVGLVLPTAVIGLFLLVMRLRSSHRLRRKGLLGAAATSVRWLLTILASEILRHRLEHAAHHCLGRGAGDCGAVVSVGRPADRRAMADWVLRRSQSRTIHRRDGKSSRTDLLLRRGDCPGFLSLVDPVWPLDGQHTPRPNGGQSLASGIYLGAGLGGSVGGRFSVAGTKLPSYIIPAYPAIALLIGCRPLAARAHDRRTFLVAAGVG